MAVMIQRAIRPAMDAARPPARATSASAVTVVAALLPWTCRPSWALPAWPSWSGSRLTVIQVWVVVPKTASASTAISSTSVDLRAHAGVPAALAVCRRYVRNRHQALVLRGAAGAGGSGVGKGLGRDVVQGTGGVDGAQRGGGLVDGFQGFGGVDGVRHDAAAGLDVGAPFPEQGRTDGDGHVHVAGEVQVAHHAAVDAAAVRLKLVQEAQGARFRGAGQRSCRERRLQDVVGLGRGATACPPRWRPGA